MGLSNMQGTSAFIEYVGERKVRKNSCKNCRNYFDGVCKTKKIAIEYGNDYGKYCKDFNPINTTIERKTTCTKNSNIKAESKSKAKNVTTTTYINGKRKKEPKINKDLVRIGCKVVVQDMKLINEKFVIEVNEGKVKEEFMNLILNHGKGYQFKYNGVLYKITSVLQGK